MHEIHDRTGRLPTAVVYGKDGKPLLSWRVTVLPYIAQEDLYAEFKLDEPWDSPHNIALLPRMPMFYLPPPGKVGKVPPYHTVVQVFVGKGTPFEGREGLKIPDDFLDGISNTILIVEGGPPVPWTKPQDMVYDPDQPLPEFCTIFDDMFRTRLADLTSKYFRKDTSEETFRAVITRDGGEKLPRVWGW